MTNTRSTRRRIFALLAILLGVANATQSFAQNTYTLAASLEQLATRNGDPVYDLYVIINTLTGTDAVVESLTAPDGTAGIEFFPNNALALRAENLSLLAAQSVFSGTWTFTERRGLELFDYEFTLPEITPNLFPETPTIVSPAHGDTIIGTEFVLDWEYPSGAEPSGSGVGSQGSAGVSVVELQTIDNTSANVLLEYDPSFSEGELTIRVGNQGSQDLDVIPVTPGGNATFSFEFLGITATSAPVTITARIPEPTTILLLGIAAPLLITRRRRRVA